MAVMENKAAELAQEYAGKLQDVRKDKETWDSRFAYFKNCAVLRLRNELKSRLKNAENDAETSDFLRSDFARRRAGATLEYFRNLTANQDKFVRKTSEIFKSDRNKLKDYRENYLHVLNPEKAFKAYPVWTEIECPVSCIENDDTRKSMAESFGIAGKDVFRFPYVLGTENCNFWLDGKEPERDIDFSHHILRSFLSFIPAGKLKVYAYDEQEMGQRIQPFLDFMNRTDDVIDIKSGPEELKTLLEELDRQVRECIQQKLGSSYKDIFAYNRASAGKSEKITLMLLYDFPGNLDKKSVEYLQKIMYKGNKCGIYTVICHRSDIRSRNYDAPDEEMVEQLSGYCKKIVFKGDDVYLMPESYKLCIPKAPGQDKMNAFIQEYKEECEQMKYRGLSFEETCAPADDEWFASSSVEGLRIPLGVGDGGETQELVIGRQGYHGLIIGGTGSGKSTLLHTIILSSMLHYSPDELQLYLMDFKSGTEFKPYERFRLPHIRLLALDAIQEFGESILEELDKEIRTRAERFKEAGVSSLKEYRSKSDVPMPRILVLIDEFQVLFDMDQNRKVADNCARLTANIVKQGRSFGIHLLMSTQSMRFGNLTIGNECFGEMRIRIGLNWADQDTLSLFGRDSGRDMDRLHKLKEGPKGTAVMTEEMGNKEEESFRVSLCENRDRYLEEIEDQLEDYDEERHVFDGQREYPLLDAFKKYDDGGSGSVSVLLGEKIKIAPPLMLKLHVGDNQNLLICGQDGKTERRLSSDYLISLARNKNAQVALIDGEVICGRAKESTAEFYEVLSRYDDRLKIAHDQGDIIRFIRQAYAVFKERKNSATDDAYVVFIRNLHYIELLRNLLSGESVDESAYVDDAPANSGASQADLIAAMMSGEIEDVDTSKEKESDNTPAAEMLYRMMRDGSSYGVYFVVTSRDYSTVRECGSFADNLLKHFKKRILFALSDDDASNLIEGVKISGLIPDTVYYTDGYLEKLQCKPYKEPATEELKIFLDGGKEND